MTNERGYGARRARAPLPASAAALGWFAGLYLLPLFHNVDHRNDHTHGPTTSPHQPHDDGETHSHPHEDAPHDPGSVPLDSDHGAGSVLHFAAAAIESLDLDLPCPGICVSTPPVPSPLRPFRPSPRLVFVRGPPLAL